MKKNKIFFILPSMNGGGAERIGSLLVNNLDRNKFDVWLVLVKKEGVYLKDINSDVKIIDLNSKSVKFSLFKIIRLFWKEKPDIVFSIAGHLNLLISMFIFLMPSKIKFIARETGIVSIRHKQYKYGKIYDYLYKIFYNNFTHIISQSTFMEQDLILNYKIKREKMSVINNPVDIEKITLEIKNNTLDLYDKNKINLLAVGGLRKVKGFDILLHVMQELDDRFYLTIIGTGKEEKSLKNLCKQLELENKVRFIGFHSQPTLYMAQADLLIMSSRHEGFPNVILEANSCGLPVVAFNSPGGIFEIIEEGCNGWLVEGLAPYDMANKIKEVSLLTKDKFKIIQIIKDRFSMQKIMQEYETLLINELLEKK